MLNAIYSSKLYKASKRKDAIAAAFDASASSELVSQLATYLDESYQPLATGVQKSNSDSKSSDQTADSSPKSDKGGAGVEDDGPNYSIPKSLHADLGPDFNVEENLYTIDDDDESIPEAGSDAESSKPEPKEAPKSEPVEESTSIHACTDILDEVGVIKGSLNGAEDTAGVNRVYVKDGELWIYYNDNVNLNSIMTNVIEFLNASGRTYLEFNRLARSDNAIVFVINSVQENIKPISAVEGAE